MVAIMAVLVGVIAPTYISYMHKARVAADWANLRSYYTVIQADYISTGEYNPDILTTDMDRPDNWRLTEITYPDGTKVKMKEGYFAIAKDGNESGYAIYPDAYHDNKCEHFLQLQMMKMAGCTSSCNCRRRIWACISLMAFVACSISIWQVAI